MVIRLLADTGGGSGSELSSIDNLGTIAVAEDCNATVACSVGGSEGLEKTGEGTLTLLGANTYTGDTTISAGTLAFADGALGSSSDIFFTGDGKLEWLAGNTDDLAGHSISIAAGATATFDTNDNDVLLDASFDSDDGSLVKEGDGALTIRDDDMTFADVTISDGELTLDVNNTAITLLTVRPQAVATLTGDGNSLDAVVEGTTSWSNISRLTISGDAVGNVSVGSLNTETSLLILDSANSGLNIDLPYTSSLRLADGTTSTVGSLAGAHWVRSFNLTLGCVSTMGDSGTLIVGDGDVSSTYSGALGAHFYGWDGFMCMPTLQDITPELELVKIGTGTLTLEMAAVSYDEYLNYCTGGTTIEEGTISISDSAALNGISGYSLPVLWANEGVASGGNPLVLNGGTLAVTGTTVWDAPMSIGSNSGGIEVATNNQFRVLSAIGGTGDLTKTGGGMLVLSQPVGYTGTTTIDSGALAVTAGNWTSADICALISGSTWNAGTMFGIDVSVGDLVYDNNLGGQYGLIKLGDDMLTLSGTNTYAGETIVSAGTLLATYVGSLPIDAETYDISIADGAALAVGAGDGNYGYWTSADIDEMLDLADWSAGASIGIDTSAGNFSYGGDITQDIGFVKLGANTLTLSGENTYSGETIVRGGTLAYGTYDAIASGDFTIDGGALDLGNYSTTAGAVTLASGGILGTGTLTSTEDFAVQSGEIEANLAGGDSGVGLVKTGSGTVTLSGSNTYAGETVVRAGTLAYGTNDAIATGNVTINGGSLDLGGYNDTVGAVTLAGGGILGTGTLTSTVGFAVQSGEIEANLAGGDSGVGLVKTGSGTVTLSGSNAYAGDTVVNSGTLVATSASALPGYDVAGKIQIAAGATLSLAVGDGGWTTAEVLDLLDSASFSNGAKLTINGALDMGIGGAHSLDFSGLTGDDSLQVDLYGELTLVNGLTLGGTLVVHDDAVVRCTTTQSIAGNGRIELDGGQIVDDETVTVTIENGVTISGTGNVDFSDANLANYGAIQADDGDSLSVEYMSLANHGTIAVTGGGSLALVDLDTGDGDDSATIQRQAAPSTTGGKIDLDWSDFSGDGYSVEVVKISGETREVVETADVTASSYETSTLEPCSFYEVTVTVENAIGGEMIYGTMTLGTGGDVSGYYWIESGDSPPDMVLNDVVFAETLEDALDSLLIKTVHDAGEWTTGDAIEVYYVDSTTDYYQSTEPSGHDAQSHAYIYTDYTIDVKYAADIVGPDTPEEDQHDECPLPPSTNASNVSASTGASQMSLSAIDSIGGCITCGGGSDGVSYVSSLASEDSDFGYGWSAVAGMPRLTGSANEPVVVFSDGSTVTFNRQTDSELGGFGEYSAANGAKQTLTYVEDIDGGAGWSSDLNGKYVFTNTDGSSYTFNDFNWSADESWDFSRSDEAGTAYIATEWQSSTVLYVNYFNSEAGAYQRLVYEYGVQGVDDPGEVGHVISVTLKEKNGASYDDVRQMSFDYYDTNGTNGSIGDLRAVTIQEYDSGWQGDDTYYFRYYVGAYNAETNPGTSHMLKYALYPESYAKLDADTSGNPDGLSDLSTYACYSFEYDSSSHVREQTNFGGTNKYDLVTTDSEHDDGYNNWDHKTVETALDGSTTTAYFNYAGQLLLTDVEDGANNYITYYQYDSSGRLVLTAEPSAVSGYSDASANLNVSLETNAGLIYTYSYYSSGAVGRLQNTYVQNGTSETPILLKSYTYTSRTVDDVTIYPVASVTSYSDTAGSDAITTSYAYSWHEDSFQIKERRTTLPEISSGQNGSDSSAYRFEYYDTAGNLVWYADELDRFTYYDYDSTTGQLNYLIEDVDSGQGLSLPSAYNADTNPTGLYFASGGGGGTPYWPSLPADGEHLQTDYTYDARGRVVEVLGPEHTADISGTPTTVRTTTWTVYNDADHETWTASGYKSGSNYYLVNPVSITKTNADGRVIEQFEAIADTTSLGTTPLTMIANEDFTQGEYTSWTVYQYTNTRLTATAVYDDIPTGSSDLDYDDFIGTAGTNYDVTTYGYEDYGASYMGRQNRVETPDGTITRYVYDGRGNVIETWIGTNDYGATDDDPGNSGAGGNTMVKISSFTYDADGYMDTSTDALGVVTHYTYDWRGRTTKVCQNYQDGTHDGGDDSDEDVTTEYEYDNLNRRIEETDVLGNVTSYAYDNLDRLYRVTQPDPDGGGPLGSPVTNYYYDDAGNLESLVDPEDNETSWLYDGLNRMTRETDELGDYQEFVYNAAGELIEKTDRNERVTTYEYDGIGRIVAEKWWNATPAVIYTCSYVYNSAGLLESVGDSEATYTYTYDDAGRVLTETHDIAGLDLTYDIVFTYQYDAVGNRTQVAATIDGTADTLTDYTYDYLGRIESIEQDDNSGNSVAEKRIDFTYDGASGQYDTITYYKALAGNPGDVVMTATYTYDDAGRLTDLVYADATPTEIRSFSWTYNAAGWITSHDSDVAAEDVTAYTYDATGQLLTATYASSNESYAYDENGNRTAANGDTYTTGDNNQTTSDGYYTYLYDDEGNLEYRFVDGDENGELSSAEYDTDVTEYKWDHRNRLETLTEYEDYGDIGVTPLSTVDYVYDCFNHRIGALYDTDGDSDCDVEDRYVWQGKNVSLDFIDADGDGETYSLELTNRYLWGLAVDQLLAQEVVDDGSVDDVLYFVRDNLGSTRSLVEYDGTIAATYSYDTFGNVISGPLTATRYLYTCQEYDLTTGFYYYDARWYDPAVGKFISEDPIGYEGGDVNLYRYVENNPILFYDPSGLVTDYGISCPPGYHSEGGLHSACCVKDADKECVKWSEPNWKTLGYSNVIACTEAVLAQAPEGTGTGLVCAGVIGIFVPPIGIGVGIGGAIVWEMALTACMEQECLEWK